MAEPGEINGWVGRARAVASVLNTLVIAPAVLVYVALVASGYLPFRPLDTIQDEIRHHRTESAEMDRRLAQAIEAFARITTRYERRDRLVECHARYPDPRMRDWCLSLGEEGLRP